MDFRHQLWEQRQKEVLCDVVLSFRGTDFPCHRCVLAATDGYFKTLLTSKYKESTENKFKIRAPITVGAFKQVLRFLYLGQIENVPLRDVMSVLTSASYFQIPKLADCANAAIKSISNLNDMTDIIESMTESNIVSIPPQLAANFDKYFDRLLSNPVMLSINYPLCVSLVSSPNIQIPDEESLLKFLDSYSKENNLSHSQSAKLASFIKWENLDPELSLQYKRIGRTIDRSVLLEYAKAYGDAMSIYPNSSQIALGISKKTEKKVTEYTKRYSNLPLQIFNVDLTNGNGSEYKLITDSISRYSGAKNVKRIGFEPGYSGTFFSIELFLEKMRDLSGINIRLEYLGSTDVSDFRITTDSSSTCAEFRQIIETGRLISQIIITFGGQRSKMTVDLKKIVLRGCLVKI